VLQLGNPHVLPANTTLVLANNDPAGPISTRLGAPRRPVFATAGFSQNLGTLMLTGTDWTVPRVIDFGDGASALAFC